MALGLTIAGVDRTTKTRHVGSLTVEHQFAARSRASFEIRDYDSFATAYRPAIDNPVTIAASGTLLFSGDIQSVRDGPLGEPGVGTLTDVEAVDIWVIALQRRVWEFYDPGLTVREVVTELFNRYVASAHPTYTYTLDPTMQAGPVLPALTFDVVTLEDAFKRIAELSGWVYRGTPDGVLEWFPVGGRQRAITFSTANRNIAGTVRWNGTRSVHANRVWLRYGTVALVEKSDVWIGDGVWTERLCTYPAALDAVDKTKITMAVIEDGIAYTPGRYGIDATPWTYELMSHPDMPTENFAAGPSNFVMIRRSAGPAPNGIYVTATYDVQFPNLVVAEDYADQAAHGIWEDIEEAPDIFDGHQAQAFINASLRRRLARPRELEFTTSVQMRLLPGDTVTVDVPERTMPSAPWLVTAVRLTIGPDQTYATELTLLEGVEAQESWVDYWRSAFGLTGGQETTGAIVPSKAGGVGNLIGGSYFLGASTVEWVQSTVPVGWIPASGVQISPRADRQATASVRLRARAGSVTARLYDLTAGQVAGIGAAVTSTSLVAQTWPVTVTGGHIYELQVLPSLPGVDVQAIGMLE